MGSSRVSRQEEPGRLRDSTGGACAGRGLAGLRGKGGEGVGHLQCVDDGEEGYPKREGLGMGTWRRHWAKAGLKARSIWVSPR